MKVGIDGRAAKWYRGTGIGTYTYQLINSINNIDELNKYLLFMPDSCNFDIELKRNFAVKNIVQNSSNNFWDEVNIPNILSEDEIELYHVPQNGVGLPFEKKSLFTITLHDVIPYKMPETVGERYLKIFNEAMPNIVSKCDGIITVSEFSKKDISKAFNYPEHKIFVTHLASEDIYRPLDKDTCGKYINKNYGINDDFILYIGGFSPRKNILGLIEAFSKLVENRNKNLKLIIGGNKGISYEKYKTRAEELGISNQVIFPGFIPLEDLPMFYSACEFFVYPSFYEGFGLPPLEAMACGTPVIASNITSMPEILGDSALLINPYNIDELYQAMKSLLEDEGLRLSLILRGIVKNAQFNWNQTAKDTLIAYNKIINNF